MSQPISDILDPERSAALGAALDTLLPPTGSFPAPSATNMIEDFILKHLPAAGMPRVYPGIDLDDLRAILDFLGNEPDTAALQRLEQVMPTRFQALWALAVFGYYSRPEVTAAIQQDLDCEYHGAPLPLGYAHVISPWDETDPLQMPVASPGRYIATDDVRPVDLSRLEASSQ